METETPVPKEPLTTAESSFLNEAGKSSYDDMVAARELAVEKSGVTSSTGQVMITEKDEQTGAITEKPVTELAKRENIMPPMVDPSYNQAREDRWQSPEPVSSPVASSPVEAQPVSVPTPVVETVASPSAEVTPQAVVSPAPEVAPPAPVAPVAESAPVAAPAPTEVKPEA